MTMPSAKNTMQPFWITTSWDDGHRLDLRLADLLDRYGMTGTFYISRDGLNPAEARLSDDEIAALAERHEVGAHTLTHVLLTNVDEATARAEIVESRAWLEGLTGRPVTAFAYPAGRTNAAARQIAVEAGFETARTVIPYQLRTGSDPWMLPTTVQVYPFPFRPSQYWQPIIDPLRRIRPYWSDLHISWLALRNWPALALALLDRAAAVGGVWHLWGHSWEIEKYGMWEALERVLDAARRCPGARFVNNTLLVREVMSDYAEPDELL